MSVPLVEISDLCVDYATAAGPLKILDGVNLTIGRGEVLGLVGESGCGKTTLGRALLGSLPKPAAALRGGTVHVAGHDLLALPEQIVRTNIRGRVVTLVPQDPFGTLDPLFRVGVQLRDLMKWKSPDRRRDERHRPALFARYPQARQRNDDRRILEMLARVQIPGPEQALQKLPGELSGGQRQRLLIAMALLPRPQLIIADEPTTALDVTIQAQILKLLSRLVDESGVSVLFTTHDLGVASELCHRIMVMYAGQEMETAPTSVFFHAPRHPYTAELLASLPQEGRPPREIAGEVPSLVDPPRGCRFHTRCSRATSACHENRPEPVTVGDNHIVRCFHPLEVTP